MSRIGKIIRLFFEHHYPEDVQKKVQDWLGNLSFDQEKDNELLTVWDSLEIRPDASTEESFRKIQHRLGQAVPRPRQRDSTARLVALSRVAAVLLIPICSFALSYFYIHRNSPSKGEQRMELVDYFVPNGEIRTIVLPDSSRVQLNSGSIIIYPRSFEGPVRSIYLNGEANFSVTKDEKKAFVVKTSDFSVEALGTVFNISSYVDSDNVSTTLESGSVAVRFNKGDTASVILLPNEQLAYNRVSGQIQKQLVDTENVFAWRDGHLVFKSLLMGDISKVLERRYGVDIYINTNKYEDQRITAKFKHNESLEELLSALQQIVPGFKYKIEGKKIFIF